MSRARPLNLLLASLLLASILPVVALPTDPATDAQEAALRTALAGNTGPKGSGQIQANWEIRNERVTMFLHETDDGHEECQYAQRTVPDARCMAFSRVRFDSSSDPESANYHSIYDPLQDNTDEPPAAPDPVPPPPVAAHGPVNFVYGLVPSEMTVFRIDLTLYMASSESQQVDATLLYADDETLLDPTAVATVPVVIPGDAITGFGTTHCPTLPLTGQPCGSYLPYTGSVDLGVTGVEIPAGQIVFLHLAQHEDNVVGEVGTNEGAAVELAYGIADTPSTISIIADSARVATWTETVDKKTVENFPTPASSSTADRTVRLRVAHVNAWGDPAQVQAPSIEVNDPETHPHFVSVVGPDGLVYYDNRPSVFGSGTSLVDAPDAQVWGAALDYPADGTPAGDGIRLNTYSLTYPPALAMEGKYNVVVAARGQNWEVDHDIVVGSTGTALERSPFEQTSTKQILIGERTTFRLVVTNTGGSRDTISVNAALGASPTGWTASMMPPMVTLDPGASAESLLTVIPSPNGRDGDLNRATVTATSLLSGRSSDPIVLTVQLTDDPTYGVKVLTDSGQVRLGPGTTRSVPIAIENTGNAKDRFIVSLQGAPAGWTVGLTPGAFDLEAKSQISPVLTIRAPSDAARGVSFPLTVKAARVDDLLVQNVKVLDVQVFLEDRFRFEVFGGTDANGKVISIPASTVDPNSATPPVIHWLRDEGGDATDQSQIPQKDPTGHNVPSGTPVSPWDRDRDPDQDYDQSTLFRLMLVNDGDRDDTVRLLPKLVTAANSGANQPNAALRARGYEAIGTTEQREKLGFQNLGGCESNGLGLLAVGADSVNDGWAMRMFDPDAATPPAPLPGAGSKQNYAKVAEYEMSVNVPAHTTKYVYVEMGYFTPSPIGTDTGQATNPRTPSSSPDPNAPSTSTSPYAPSACGQTGNRIQGELNGARVGDPAPGHAIAVEAISQNDPAQRNTHFLNARIVGAGRSGGSQDATGFPPAAPGQLPQRIGSQRYSHQDNDVTLELEKAERAGKIVTLEAAEAPRTATYRLRAVNTGNEMDILRITMPQFQDGWEQRFANVPTAANGLTLSSNLVNGQNAGGAPGRTARCTTPAVVGGNIQVECTMGAYDEVAFDVLSIAPANGALGTTNPVIVRATSKDSFGSDAGVVEDVVTLTTRLTGAFVFDLLPNTPSVSVQVYPGGTVAAPFTLRNLGTQEDHLNLDLSIAPAATTGWSADFSQANPLFLPPERDINGFLSVRAPAGAHAGDQERFRIRATSQGAPGTPPSDVLDVVVSVIAEPTAFEITGDPVDVVAKAGDTVDLTVRATRAAGNTATGVTFRLDPASLPLGWTSTTTAPVAATYDAAGKASAVLKVASPADAIGTSRGAIRVTGTDSANVAKFTEIGVSLSSPTVGVALNSTTGDVLEVVSGTTASTVLELKNLGTGLDTATMSVGTVPTGWAVTFDPVTQQLQPLETRNVTVTISAPPGLEPGEERLFRIQATSSDPTRFDVLELTATTGTSVPELAPKVNGTLHQLPEEPFSFVLTVGNNGTMGDDLDLVPALGAFDGILDVEITPSQVSVEPGEAEDVLVTVTIPKGLVPGTEIPVGIEARSIGPFLDSVGGTTVGVVVLNYTLRDVDGDAIEEYAVDRNLDMEDGYEAIRDPSSEGARTELLDMVAFLDEDGLADHTVNVPLEDGNTTQVVVFLFDGDRDGRSDLMLDTDGDRAPDVYWDPDRGHSAPIPLAKDVTGDGAREYFLDVDGLAAQALDVYYDAAAGEFGDLIQVDIDNSGAFDYVVDSNGNGRVDLDETVLYGGPDGELVKVTERRDVDGDGHLDTVVDTDADGDPDYFIPNGKTTGVPITLEDVNGDGSDDWTYDSDGDGTRDSYYDPLANEVGQISPGNAFLNDLKDYFYIPVLFGLVLVLFVVLVAVTRK